MKTLHLFILSVALTSAIAAESASLASPETSARAVDTNSAATTTAKPADSAAPTAEPSTESTAVPAEGGTNELRMNFRGASLEMVLNYLSEAAGYIINVKPGASVRGKVDVWSNKPMTREEALNLLDTVLNQNGLAAIRNGRTLTIVNRDEAKIQDTPVISNADPDKIPKTDQIVTQIIPVRFVEVTQLAKDLQPLVSVQTTLTANEAGNAILITDTQANIHRVAEIIKAIDMGAEDVTELRVFRLTNADPNEISEMLSNLFPDDTKAGNSQSPVQFGGLFSRFAGRFGGGGGFGAPGGTPGGATGGGGGGANSQNQRIKKRNRVIAVADQRTAAVIVSATRDLMEQIEGVITDLDANPKGRTTVRVFHFENADPQEALPVLQDIFQKNQTQNSRNQANSSQNSPLVNRSTTQNQQNNSASRSTMTPNSRGGGVNGAAFGQ